MLLISTRDEAFLCAIKEIIAFFLFRTFTTSPGKYNQPLYGYSVPMLHRLHARPVSFSNRNSRKALYESHYSFLELSSPYIQEQRYCLSRSCEAHCLCYYESGIFFFCVEIEKD